MVSRTTENTRVSLSYLFENGFLMVAVLMSRYHWKDLDMVKL
jgi:hypothetical protein